MNESAKNRVSITFTQKSETMKLQTVEPLDSKFITHSRTSNDYMSEVSACRPKSKMAAILDFFHTYDFYSV
jgi:hypothetical protein